MSRPIAFALAALLAAASAVPARAQVTRDDSAAVLLDAARRLDAEGQRPAADAVLGYLLRYYPGTAAALTADSLLSVRAAAPEQEGSGRVQLVAWGALYGAFLGVAVPAMLGADDPTSYGVGLLLGGPAGFFAAQRYATAHQVTSGQAAAMTFGFRWGAWQALGWRAVLDVGNTTTCYGTPPSQWCDEDPGRSPWTAMVLGGLGGLATGAVIGNSLDPSAGRVAFASHGGYWGTWLGFVLTEAADVQADDQTLTAVLLAGDAGLLLGALTAPADVSVGRVWLTSALGIAGTAAGFGLDLIVQPNGTGQVLLIPAATGIVGLALGWRATREMDARRPRTGAAPGGAALLERCASCGPAGRAAWRVGAPGLAPTLVPVGENAHGRREYRPAVSLPLLRAEF